MPSGPAREGVSQLNLEQIQLQLIASDPSLLHERPAHQLFSVGALIRREPRAAAEQVEEDVALPRRGQGWRVCSDRRPARCHD